MTAALRCFIGFYLGFLLYEVGRRDWKNVVLIATVGVLNGLGWAICQNWQWAPALWPDGRFNWWRCWESSGGISMGIAYGIAYFLVNRPMSPGELAVRASRRLPAVPGFEWLLIFWGLTSFAGIFFDQRMAGWDRAYVAVVLAFGTGYFLLRPNLVAVATGEQTRCDDRVPRGRLDGSAATDGLPDANLERFGLYLGLLAGMGLSIRNGLKGWFNIYRGNENYWNGVLWQIFGPALLIGLIALAAYILLRPWPRHVRGPVFPHAFGLMWLVLIVQNAIAQLITGPLNQWNEVAFSIYYLLLFAISAVIIIHMQTLKVLAVTLDAVSGPDAGNYQPAPSSSALDPVSSTAPSRR